MTENALIDSLRSIVGDDRMIPTERLSLYEVDGLTPQVAVCPDTAEQVASVLAAAAQAGAGVIPWGGGTGIAIGNTPSRYDIALDVTRLNQVVDHEPEDLTVVVQAGARLQQLQDVLGGAGQHLPFDPPVPASATIGGILAANSGGPGRHAYGWPRDWTLGMKVALSDGTVAKSGGRVVKNVAGYDMGKLFIGSFGTLGVIVEAAFKVVPLPEARGTLVAAFDSPSRAVEAALAVHKLNLAVESLAVASPAALEGANVKSDWTLLVASAGGAPAVERTLGEAESVCREHRAGDAQRLSDDEASTDWQAVRQLMLPSTAGGSLLARAGLIPSNVAAFLERQSKLAPTVKSVAYPALGAVYGLWDQEILSDNGSKFVSSLRQSAAAVNASLVLMACPPSLKQEVDVWGDGRSDLPLMRRIKEQLDPRSTLSPGRFLGRM